MASIELEGVENVRDLGGIPTADGRHVKRGLIYRGSALFHATDADKDLLFRQLGIECVIDLRTGWERAAKPDPVPEKVEYLRIPYFDQETLGIDYCKPIAGTIVIGNDFACDPHDFYTSMANPITIDQMRKSVESIFSRAAHGKPVYEHCSGGKDRAGVTAFLLLTVLGVSYEEAMRDYLLTNVSRERHIGHIYQRFLRLTQGDEDYAQLITEAHSARTQNVDAFLAEVHRRYGSTDDFIRNQLRISDVAREQFQAQCLE